MQFHRFAISGSRIETGLIWENKSLGLSLGFGLYVANVKILESALEERRVT
jgi:hypothetical protein